MNYLDQIEGVKSSRDLLMDGDHKVRVISVASGDSATNYDGSPSEKVKEYSDVTRQVIVTLGNDEGVRVRRFNLDGFKKYDELDEEYIKKHKITKSSEGYALVPDGDDLVRISDEKKTEECKNIISDFIYKVGIVSDENPHGAKMEEYIANRNEIMCKIVKKEWDGKPQYVPLYFWNVTSKDLEKEIAAAAVESLD